MGQATGFIVHRGCRPVLMEKVTDERALLHLLQMLSFQFQWFEWGQCYLSVLNYNIRNWLAVIGSQSSQASFAPRWSACKMKWKQRNTDSWNVIWGFYLQFKMLFMFFVSISWALSFSLILIVTGCITFRFSMMGQWPSTDLHVIIWLTLSLWLCHSPPFDAWGGKEVTGGKAVDWGAGAAKGGHSSNESSLKPCHLNRNSCGASVFRTLQRSPLTLRHKTAVFYLKLYNRGISTHLSMQHIQYVNYEYSTIYYIYYNLYNIIYIIYYIIPCHTWLKNKVLHTITTELIYY